MPRKQTEGFTLLELSIVLVIIGLLIGGIFVGQSLIHNAQLNAVITEFNRYQTAVQSFKQQYQALPGDMNNATSFWGIAGGTGSDTACATTVSTTAATCNGNGDGTLSYPTPIVWEWLRFWQHLANAKMIEGNYTGTGNPPNASGYANPATAGVNMPTSKFGNNAGWSVLSSAQLASGNAVYTTDDYGAGNIFLFGVGGNWLAETPVLTPKDAWSIDKKIDDGKPAQGNVIASQWALCSTATSSSDLTGSYKLSTGSAACGLIFLTSF